jgi:hypothetical protein
VERKVTRERKRNEENAPVTGRTLTTPDDVLFQRLPVHQDAVKVQEQEPHLPTIREVSTSLSTR